MIILIDSNVILDYLLVRQPEYSSCVRLLASCQNKDVKGYLAFHTLPSIWYILRKYAVPNRREVLSTLTNFLEVISAPHEKVVEAIKQENFSDFEDCLQEKCASGINADYIVTNNTKDFRLSQIPAITPTETLKILFKSKNKIK